jgi:NAD-dependent DNA ligase
MTTFNKFINSPLEYAQDIPIKKLETYLRKLSALYYNSTNSPISDKIFDNLKDILESRDPDNPFLGEIGAPIERNKTKLPFPMGSLNKIKPDNNEFDKWIQIYHGSYELSDKMDGISALIHRTNETIKMYSRGDGKIGQDITHLLKYINVDITKIPNETAIRGELIMTKKNFKKISNKMANARNAVAGIVNSKTLDTKMAKLVDFIAYNIVFPRYLQSKQYKLLEQWNFDVVEYVKVDKISIASLLEYFKQRRELCEYEIDGIVVMDNNMIYDVVEGNPKYGFAFKSIMENQFAIATVIDVEWKVSRYNYIKPRIKIEPLDLVGVTITYATAHNARFVYDNKIGKGSKIKIIRSGDVIPKIMEVITPSKNGKPLMPNIPYKWNDTHVDILAKEKTTEVKNVTKMKQLVNTMKTLGVKNIDEGLSTQIVSEGYVTLPDMLNADLTEIQKIIGAKMTEKIYKSIYASLQKTQLHILMASSNYFGRGIGAKKLHVITKEYPDIMKTKWSDDKLFDKINQLDGFQEKTTQKFIDGFPKFKKYFNEINKKINIEYLIEPTDSVSGDLFAGKKIVVTGFRDANIIKFIEDNGGENTGTVSRKTHLVICADLNEDSNKMTTARDIGTTIMTKEAFIKKYMKK